MIPPAAAHLTDDQALAYAVGALGDRARADVASHVAGCTTCAVVVARFDREQAALFAQLRASADAHPPGRATEWSVVRDRVIEPHRGFAWTWRWAVGTIGGLSAPFLFAVGVASAAGVGYATLPPVRNAVHRALGIAEATETPVPSPTSQTLDDAAGKVDPTATATPIQQPLPSPLTGDGTSDRDGSDGNHGDDAGSADRAASATLPAAPLVTPSPTVPAGPPAEPTTTSNEPWTDPSIGVGGAGVPTALPPEPTAPAGQPDPTIVRPPHRFRPTPPPRPTADPDERRGPGGGRPPFPPPGAQPGPGPGPGPHPTEAGGPPPDATPGASRTPHRRERGPGRGGRDRPPDGGGGEGTPGPDWP